MRVASISSLGANGGDMYRQAAEEPRQDNARHGEDKGREEEGEVVRDRGNIAGGGGGLACFGWCQYGGRW